MENRLIQTVFYLLLATSIAVSGYIVGYKHGGADYGYLERVLTGIVVHSESRQCERSSDPAGCYGRHSEMRTADALGFYADYNDRMSPLARYLFPDQHGTYRSAVGRIFANTARGGPKAVCDRVREVDQERFTQCREKVLEFLQTAKYADYTRQP